MLNLVPAPAAGGPPRVYGEALARLASIRHALRLVDPFGGGPASDPSDDDRIAAAWTGAGRAKARCLEGHAERTAGAAAAGLEALLGEQSEGREPNQAAAHELADEIRRGLEDVARMMRGA